MIAEADSFVAGNATSTRHVRVGLLGCGAVGSAVARLLIDSRTRLRASNGIDIELTRILVRDRSRRRSGIDARLLTNRFDDVLGGEPDVMIEALGGREPAATFVRQALERGISVVSANKTLIAHDGPALEALATRQTGLSPSAEPRPTPRLCYEASVGAAIPVLAAIRQRAGDSIISLRAVLNGTSNYVLDRMRETGLPLQAVLQEAVTRGLAEPDPSADISGRDTAEKLCILARAAGFAHITPNHIPMTGIEDITLRDLDAAREHGCVVRLTAELEATGQGRPPRLRVGPAFVPIAHPLGKARGAENVIVLDQEYAGRLVLQGEGAGPRPTSAAILGDLLNVLAAIEGVASRTQSHIGPVSSTPVRRVFVRLPRSHEAAETLHRHAVQVHSRRDVIEAIVEGDADGVGASAGALVAPLLR